MKEFQPSDSEGTAGSAETATSDGITVTFEDLGIEVSGLGEDFGSTCLSVVEDLIPFRKKATPKRNILEGVTGRVCPGEMMLVLGRPGSGCTSLLKVLSNHRDEFNQVHGQIFYDSMGPEEAKKLRHKIVMNTEDDLHFPTLKVSETIEFANSAKIPSTSSKDQIKSASTQILESLGIAHTKDTMVGNEYVRGVSGGERKRVSLAEVLSTQAPLQCWDNSTRGLDASSALEFARVLRRSAMEENKTIIATLYQAGNGIYDQFDKVLVLAEGRQIYYGPSSEAKKYFEDMGFICPPGANIADFLTSVAVHTEREIAPGFEDRVPDTASEFERRYRDSDMFKRMSPKALPPPNKSANQTASEVTDSSSEKSASRFRLPSGASSPYTASFARQVWICSIRQLEILWGDRFSNGLQLASSLLMALVTGSLMYNLPDDSTSIFRIPGALFYPIMLWGLNKMAETVASFRGRSILTRHKRLAFNRPSAYALACVLTDIPFTIIMFSLFNLVYYFMVGYQHDAGKFFTNWFIYFVVTLCFTSLYRTIGAWCKHFGLAAQISGWVTMVMMVYAGYLIPVTSMHPWFRWIAYINPATYAFAAVMASEVANREMACVAPQLVPFGPAYTDQTLQSCTVLGSSADGHTIDGAEYLQLQYDISRSEVWRNVGIIIALWVFFSITTAIGFEVNLASEAGSKILYDRRSQMKEIAAKNDLEKSQIQAAPEPRSDVLDHQTTFTFKNINYVVQHDGKPKQLLHDVSGYVKPGQLVALMGSSGAGKTTLMDVLAQRKDSGHIDGSIMVNGKPQGVSFQRTTGYCEQNDVHEPTATVFEALLFSARLRQSHDVPDGEKVAYVEQIMDLLELTSLKHAIIGVPGSGLSIEQRKRLTLATELVARPSLLFLDEPTSGLDGQSAFEICRFMRKLAMSGQTIICTIHQPSAALFEAFDVLLLLGKEGRTTYFGPTGKNSCQVLEYFAKHGAHATEDTNPAEHIIDVIQGRLNKEIDWPSLWNQSEEKVHVLAEIESLNSQQDLGDARAQTMDEESNNGVSDFASPLLYQLKLVTIRQLIALWRNPDYIWNKIGIHISNSLFAGFTFWMIGNGTFDLQLRLMAVFNFVFVAVGCISQSQPLFIKNRDLFETREKKSKTYHWFAFISAQLLAEIPVLILCAVIYFCCWYFTAGFPVKASISGQVFLQMLLYEFLYTSIGQAIAAYSPNDYFAALANPIFIGAGLINFCGVVVPYSQIQPFWRYWIYYLDPFTYLIGGLLEPVVWDVQVECKANELARIPFSSQNGTTCGDYMADFISANGGYLTDPSATDGCSYCAYSSGAEYLRAMNINEKYYGWRDVGITALFCVSSFALVFLMMKLRTKATKKAGQ
ncbi:ABC-2 type transporter-domain-containing protein [Stachybotrys elegans]|uniref:ABC-2 type transporter-domain-containing protein n=1 Tax=Stachybotrys elegans TaxID=80388 RepID=A0A8K0SI34_9HYPO|nr:ABC-2 type transporter-domain-containing protein [Stachybotrys elegans]